MMRWAGAVAGLGMAMDVDNILRNGLENSIGDIIDFAFTLIGAIILPSLGFWEGLGFAASFAARLAPWVAIVSLIFAIALVALDIYMLQTGPCRL